MVSNKISSQSARISFPIVRYKNLRLLLKLFFNFDYAFYTFVGTIA